MIFQLVQVFLILKTKYEQHRHPSCNCIVAAIQLELLISDLLNKLMILKTYVENYLERT